MLFRSTSFLNGRRANGKELDNLSQVVDNQVLYAEWSFRELFIVTTHKLDPPTAGKLRGHFSIDELNAYTPEYFQKLVVALIDEHDEPICLALIENVDFAGGTLIMRARRGSVELARAIQFSELQLII